MNELLMIASAPVVFSGFLLVIALVFAAASVGLWIWSLVHCIQNRHLSDSNRIIGIVLIIVLGLIGSLVYLFLPKEPTPQR